MPRSCIRKKKTEPSHRSGEYLPGAVLKVLGAADCERSFAMRGLIKVSRIALIAAGNLTATILSGCGSGSSAPPPPPVISISFTGGSSETVAQGQSVTITAAISNDTSGKGVTWKLSGPGALSKQTSTSVEYDAPASVASNVTAMITATAVADPAKSAPFTVTITPPPAISVSVSPDSVTLAVNTTQQFTAIVQNDSSNAGVTWTISPASGAGALSNATSTSVTYHAPADAPASNLTVALTATSVADTSKSHSAIITVPAISLGVSPSSALMPVNTTQQFTATVNFDPTGKGATWAPMQGGASCGPACGTFAPTSTASGATTTYTAPAAVPANAAVAITATSVTDNSKSGAAAITLTNGTVELVPARLNFGNVKYRNNGQRSMTLALTNTGKTTLSISSMAATAHFSQMNDCGASVGAGLSCTITVTFTPGATGSFTGTLTISDSSADSPQVVYLSGTGTALIAASMSSALATEITAAAPSPTGPSDVGTRVVDLTDSTRDDPFLADGSKRELPVRFWYPATLHQDCIPADYASPSVWSYFSQLVGVPLPKVRTNSCQDAPITSGAHPIVVFTPGYTGTFTDSTSLFEDLASRGYVVASVNHTNEATAVEFSDGRFVKSFLGSHLRSTLRTDEEAYTSAEIG